MNQTEIDSPTIAFADHHPPNQKHVFILLCLCILPSLCMVFGALSVFLFSPGPRMISAFQHLSAGLLLGAVLLDLFPIHKQSSNDMVFLCVGMIGGSLIFLLLGSTNLLTNWSIIRRYFTHW